MNVSRRLRRNRWPTIQSALSASAWQRFKRCSTIILQAASTLPRRRGDRMILLQCVNWRLRNDAVGQDRQIPTVRVMSAYPRIPTGIATRQAASKCQGTTCKHGLVTERRFCSARQRAINLFRRVAAGPTISIRQWVTPWDDWISSAISTAAK